MFFYRLRNTLNRMFYGRNGIDKLNTFLLVLYCILAVFNMFVLKINGRTLLYIIIQLILVLLCILILFRAFSRKISARRRENYKYLSIKTNFFSYFSLCREKFRNRKTHVYKKCPHCRANIKLPRKKGSHTVCCPKCRIDFKVKI